MEQNSEKALKISGFVSVVLLILTAAYFYLFAHTEDLDGYIYLGEYYYGEIDGMVSLLCFSVINVFLSLLFRVVKKMQKELDDTGCVLKYTLHAVIFVFAAMTLFSILLLSYIWPWPLDEYTQILPLLVYGLSIICSLVVMIMNKEQIPEKNSKTNGEEHNRGGDSGIIPKTSN